MNKQKIGDMEFLFQGPPVQTGDLPGPVLRAMVQAMDPAQGKSRTDIQICHMGTSGDPVIIDSIPDDVEQHVKKNSGGDVIVTQTIDYAEINNNNRSYMEGGVKVKDLSKIMVCSGGSMSNLGSVWKRRLLIVSTRSIIRAQKKESRDAIHRDRAFRNRDKIRKQLEKRGTHEKNV